MTELENVCRLIPGYDPFATGGDAWFDAGLAEKAIAFFPRCLHHVEGELAGEPFRLEPWQQAIVGNLFGWQRKDARGRTVRRYRECLLYVPRKNGKTPLAAGIGLFVFFCDRERGQQDFIAAADREQAGMLFRHAKGMVDQEPTLASRCRIYGGTAQAGQSRSLVRESDGSFLRVISAEAGHQHGQNVHLALIDELHQQPNRELVEVLRTGTASLNRAQPLTIHITTADFDRPSVCNDVYDYAIRVRDGKIDNRTFLPVIYEAQIADDWRDRAVWARANPNLGVSVSEEYIAGEVLRCREEPAYLNTFLRLHLNVRTKAHTRWIDPEAWKGSAGTVDVEALAGCECAGGLDLSAKYDLSAFVLIFPIGDGSFQVLSHFWIPAEAAEKWERKNGVPYSAWARDGKITLTPGASVDYDAIERFIEQAGERYQIKALAYDPWNANATRTRLSAFGLPMVEFPQNLKRFNEPTKEFGRLVKEGLLHHGGHPVLDFCAESVEVYTDPSGNIRPVKPEEGVAYKIDGIVAGIMALDHYVVNVPPRSAYEDGGVYSVADLMFDPDAADGKETEDQPEGDPTDEETYV